MFTLLNEVHFWTFRSEIAIRDTDFGSFCYYEKRCGNDNESVAGKKSYSQQRGIVWSPSNKRPAKLRHSIKELEECLESSRVIYSQWKEPDCLLVILSSGLLISLKINILSGDLEHVHFDKHLLNKLSSEYVSDVAVGGSEAVFALKGGKVLAVHYAKSALKSSSKHWVTVDTRSSDLVATSNQQSTSLCLRISSNSTSDKLAVWWEQEGDPWQHMSSTTFPPIHIYHFSNLKAEPACCLRTEAQPILVVFSHFRPSILHIVVQTISPRGDMWLGWCQMDISCLRGDRGTAVQPHRTIPVQSRVVAVSLSPAEDKILIACSDSTLIVADYAYDCVVTNRTTFQNSARMVTWHPDSCILVASDERANIQFFDSSLSPIRSQFTIDQHSPLLYLDIGAYFKHQPTLMSLSWNKKPTVCNSTLQIDAYLFLHFERGPLAVLKLIGGSRPGYPVDSIVCQYLSSGSVDRAISLLSTLAWDTAGSAALASLQSIVNYLLAQPLTPQRHGLLEKAVASYFDRKRSISRVTCVEFNDSVTDIRRKIFHHLLRYQVYEAALKLAVDLGHYDLLMDVHNQAKVNGFSQLAITALEKAEQISEYSTSHSRSSVSSHSSYESSCSWCSRSSCSQCREEVEVDRKLKQNKNNARTAVKSNGQLHLNKTNKALEQDGNSSQASSKTSLLHYHLKEDGRGEKDKSSDSCVNNFKVKNKSLVEFDEGDKEEGRMISQPNPFTNKTDIENTKTEHNQLKQPIDNIHQGSDDCVRIDINDDAEEGDEQNSYEGFEMRSNSSKEKQRESRNDICWSNAKNISNKAVVVDQNIGGDENYEVCQNKAVEEDEMVSRTNSEGNEHGTHQNNVVQEECGTNRGKTETLGVNHGFSLKDDNTYSFRQNIDEGELTDGEFFSSSRDDCKEEQICQKGNNIIFGTNKKKSLKIDRNHYGNNRNNFEENEFGISQNKLDKGDEGRNITYQHSGDNTYRICQVGDKFIKNTRADGSYGVNPTTTDSSSCNYGELDSRILADYDKDCLADVETGMRLEICRMKNESTGLNGTKTFSQHQEAINGEKQYNLNCSLQGPNSSMGQTVTNGFTSPIDVESKNPHQDIPQQQGQGQMHISSLWGRDRVHVHNVVGDQWFGSLVRVAKTLKTPLTSQNIYPERQEPVEMPLEEWTDYQTYITYRKQSSFESDNRMNQVEYQQLSTYQNAQAYNNVGHCQENQATYDNSHNQWPPVDPRLNLNMCDLQKESFISENTRHYQRQEDKIPNVVHHNWMEPHSVTESQEWKSVDPSSSERWSSPSSSFQSSLGFNRWNGKNFESNKLYEHLNPNATRWDDSTKSNNRFINSERGLSKWNDSNAIPERPHELSPARVGPNLWISPQSGNNGSGIFWPKPYLGPRERPPPPPPPPPPRPKVQFSESVTHIPLPLMEEIQESVVEGNINTVGLPDAGLSGYHSVPRRQAQSSLSKKPMESTHNPPPVPPSLDTNQGNVNKSEETSKVKVVHFGLV